MQQRWTAEEIGDQGGRTAIVTGANTGIGFAAARALTIAGARVVLACRSRERGQLAMERIAAAAPAGQAELALLDLASLVSVRDFARSIAERGDRLDLLINNAGVMGTPSGRTADGFELQLGINHLGHFALTGLLLPLLRRTPGARVVTVSSQCHRFGRIAFDDLDFTRRRYDAMAAYAQSKLANLLFTAELQRRLQAAGADTLAVAAHPGWAATELPRHSWSARLVGLLLAVDPAQGALPTLRAAVDPDVRGGECYGPGGLFGLRGPPTRVEPAGSASSEADAQRLWEVSEQLTGVTCDLLAVAA